VFGSLSAPDAGATMADANFIRNVMGVTAERIDIGRIAYAATIELLY
jgi:hypothetical protein